MILFFDTSALVKYFHYESGTEIVTQLIDSKENQIWVLDIARIEFFSALSRRFRIKEIDKNQYDEINTLFEAKSSVFNIIITDTAIIQLAEKLIKDIAKTSGLRTLDALHLAAYIFSCDTNWKFVTSDQILCDIVKFLGHDFINPLQ